MMNGSIKVDFLIAHPHKHHVYHLAKGISNSGATSQLVVPLYNKGILKILAGLPFSAANKLRGYEYTELDPKKITTSLNWAFRKFLSIRSSEAAFEHFFDKVIAEKIVRNHWEAKTFVSLQDYMPNSVAAAQKKGWKIWSDQILNNSTEVNANIAELMLEFGVIYNKKSEKINSKIIESAAIITAPSKFVATSISNFRDDFNAIKIIPYGVECEKFKISAAQDIEPGNSIRVLARANAIRKGGGLLVEAIRSCGAEMVEVAGAPIHFDILGAFEPALRDHVSKIKMPSGITISDKNYPHSEVSGLIAKSNFFIMPSLAEGMSLIATEVMAIGRPIILTKQCGIEELNIEGAGIIANATTEGIARAIIEMLNKRDSWKDMGKKASKVAREYYLWSRYESQISELALSIINN